MEWELIDARARWGGLLLLDGALLRSTAAMLGDWDLQSTLLRRAVQTGSRFVEAPPGALALLDRRSAIAMVEDELGREAIEKPRGLIDRFFFLPAARALARPAMRAMLAPSWFDWAAIGLTLIGTLGFIAGWRWPGYAALLIAGPVDAVGQRIAALAWRPTSSGQWRIIATAVSILALGWRIFADGEGWGALTLALTVVGLWIAVTDHHRFIGKPAKRPLWLANLDDLIWLLLPFALFGAWRIGLGVIALDLFATLLMTQRLTARKGNERP
jgi:hypothetical protein